MAPVLRHSHVKKAPSNQTCRGGNGSLLVANSRAWELLVTDRSWINVAKWKARAWGQGFSSVEHWRLMIPLTKDQEEQDLRAETCRQRSIQSSAHLHSHYA